MGHVYSSVTWKSFIRNIQLPNVKEPKKFQVQQKANKLRNLRNGELQIFLFLNKSDYGDRQTHAFYFDENLMQDIRFQKGTEDGGKGTSIELVASLLLSESIENMWSMQLILASSTHV